MTKLFISHSSKDDAYVRDLRLALADHGQQGWVDSRELRCGDPLWSAIQQAIETASAYAVVVSPDALQSKWVGKELRLALKVQKQRGKDNYPVIPLSLNDTKLGVLEEFFAEEPVYLPVTSGAGGVEAAMNALLVALGKRLPALIAPTPQPDPEPLEELVLELTDLKFHEQDGIRRASARARLVYEPAMSGQREVATQQSWRLIAPIGPIETGEMSWYLEHYAIWPSHYFRDRARKVEENLVKWGQLLHDAAIPVAHRVEVMKAWEKTGDHAGRRFSVHVDVALEAGAPEADVKTAQEVATLLLGLPWELLHDGERYLFQGAKPTRVRRTLPGTEAMGVAVVATPIRILLVTARPEDDACDYIDHRVSAMPLVEAMESLPGLVKIHVLSPPTLLALRDELDRARRDLEPYHVVHFDGHGVYDKSVGLGGLCFELPEDTGKLEGRRHVTVFTDDLGPLLRDHRIPLIFLDACQTAQAENVSDSVASELLKVGVASVVAMSHSVLIETARRFVTAFYRALADGKRVGDAMLAGQRRLKDDTFRGRIFGAGELRLEDWFVPVLFQEKDDPQLFTSVPARQTREDFQIALATRLGDLPPVPETGFIGRSRELLALQRLLNDTGFQPVSGSKGLEVHATMRYAVVRGQGGEGKTALTTEFARWLVRSQQIRRAAFVSVEGFEKNIAESILDKLGQQLLTPGFLTKLDCNGDVEKAKHEIERALREQPTLLVIDNMESVLLPPYIEQDTPDPLSQEAREELAAILTLCERLLKVGDTRLIFTSREPLPKPFDTGFNRIELPQLDREDAIKLVERALNCGTGFQPMSDRNRSTSRDAGATLNAAREEIEVLVDTVHCHARTLALLAPSLSTRGVTSTCASLTDLMAEMEKTFPGSREHSLFAGVELSLRRLSPANRDRAHVLGVFYGAADLEVLRVMMEWENADAAVLANELIKTGLATPNRYNHLTLNPALCPYLRGRMETTERVTLTSRWVTAMRAYAKFLQQQQSQHIEVAVTLMVLELPNFFALLDHLHRAGDAEATIDLTTVLYDLLYNAGKSRLLARIGQVRDTAVIALGAVWNHAQFQTTRTRIEQHIVDGHLREAVDEALKLIQRARAVGENAYPNADYDLAIACLVLARVLKITRKSEQALPLLNEARQHLEVFEKRNPGCGAERVASICFAEQGDCLRNLGRLDEAATAYEENIHRAIELGDDQQVAVGKGQIGILRMEQGRYQEALEAYEEARKHAARLDMTSAVAEFWHQTGIVYHAIGQTEAAEDAYRKSLAIRTQIGEKTWQASTLGQLGILYLVNLGRLEEASAFFRQAVDKYIETQNKFGEGLQRVNLAQCLRKLHRFDEARKEIQQAFECGCQFGHEASPWNTWQILSDIETDAGNPAAAAEAKRQAIACYLAYRRDGGENKNPDGRISLDDIQSLLACDPATAASLLQQFAANPKLPSYARTFLHALQAIIAGSRDRTLADAPDLNFMLAAEILFLIETLEIPSNT